jgi:hypothetical protein
MKDSWEVSWGTARMSVSPEDLATACQDSTLPRIALQAVLLTFLLLYLSRLPMPILITGMYGGEDSAEDAEDAQTAVQQRAES